jgi:hypothetical protein
MDLVLILVLLGFFSCSAGAVWALDWLMEEKR